MPPCRLLLDSKFIPCNPGTLTTRLSGHAVCANQSFAVINCCLYLLYNNANRIHPFRPGLSARLRKPKPIPKTDRHQSMLTATGRTIPQLSPSSLSTISRLYLRQAMMDLP